MSSRLDKAIKDFIQIIREAGNKGTSPLDAQAEVLRIDEDGTAWVHLPGGVDETPVKLTINAEVGDKVYVRLSGGRAWITGNQTAPPTDDKTAVVAKSLANIAGNRAKTAQKTADQAQVVANSALKGTKENAAQMAKMVVEFNGDIANLQDQIDGNISTWFYDVDPDMGLPPVTDWDTNEKKDAHLGDIYYNTVKGYAWRFMKSGSTYSWERITDTDVTKALADAAKAQDTADSKRRVFYNTPTVPYDAGDLWVQGSGGDILRCAQAKTSTGSYDRNDWVLASKYTDDSALNTWIEGDFATTIKELEEGLVDAKVETYYQTTDPSTGWSDTQKSEHKGDLWYNSTESVQKYYRWSGTAWQELTATPPQAVFDNIDKKATIYTGTTTPTNPDSGDLWFKGADEPILTYVNNSWVEYNKYTDDSAALAAQTDINALSDKTRSGYIETLSGSGFVQSTKTEDGGASEVVVYGKSNQKVTQQSANLCPTYDKWTLSGGAYIDGDYIVFPSNGATAVVDVHWKNASNILYFYINSKRDSDDAASLIIKADNGNGWATELQTDETTYTHTFGGNNVYGDTLLGMTYVRFTLMHYQTTTGSMRIKNFMVSSTNTPYVPFVPDSPSPEYPSEIQSVENPIVTACGKNLIDRSKNTMNSYIEQDTGIMISSATAASYNAEATDFIPVEVGEPYYYSGYISENIGNTGAMYDDNKNFVAPIISDSDIAPLVVPNGVSYIRLTIWGIYYENGDKSVAQLEKGSTPTDYEPYKGNTATLSDIVLRSTPDGTRDKLFKDIDGLWKVDRKYGVVDLGTLTWTYVSTGTRFNAGLPNIKNVADVNTKANIVCPLYVAGTLNDTWNGKDDVISANTDSHLIIVRDTAYTDATTFKSAMSGVMAVYELATPTYETLPDSIQAELNALTTYNPVTNVMVSDGVTPDIDVSFWTRDYRAKNMAENAASKDELASTDESIRQDIENNYYSHTELGQSLSFNETDGLIIQVPNSPYETRISNTQIEFRYQGQPVAYINGEILVIPKSMMLDEMMVGNNKWSWRIRDNGNLQLKWIG